MGPACSPPLNLPALGRRQPPYVPLRVVRRPVFLLNSRLGRFTAPPGRRAPHLAVGTPPPGGPLLPKLRGQFAEFLSRGSPVRLGTLMPAYQCRCAVRTPVPSLAAFLAGTKPSPLALAQGPRPPHPPSGSGSGLPTTPSRPWGLDAYGQQDAATLPPGPRFGRSGHGRDGTINPLSIASAPFQGLWLRPA